MDGSTVSIEELSNRFFTATVVTNMASAMFDALNAIFEELNAAVQLYAPFIIAGHTFFAV